MRKLILTICFMLIFSTQVSAEIIDKSSIENAVPEEANEILNNSSIDDSGDIEGYINTLGQGIVNAFHLSFKDAYQKAIIVVSVVLLCSLAGLLIDDKKNNCIALCGTAIIALFFVNSTGSYIDLCTGAIDSIAAFSKILLPAMCTACAFCGTITTAAAQYAASALFLDIFIELAKSVLLPLIMLYIALNISTAVFDNELLSAVSKLVKSVCTTMMIALSLAFTAYLTISTSIASSTDAVATKVAKTAISTALPVVGGIISDAASSVVAGASLLINSVGVFGLAVILAVCVTPFAVLGLNYLLLKAAGVAAASMDKSGVSKLISGFAGSVGMMLGLVGTCGAMMFMAVISCMKAVSS